MTRQDLNKLLLEYEHSKRSVEDEQETLEQARKDTQAAHEAQNLVQHLAEQIQSQAHQQLASVVTSSMEAVFPDAYKFSIDFERKRGRTEARLLFSQGNMILTNPTFESGGGNIDIAAMALRLSCLMLSRPKRRMLLVMDEPMKNVNGKENRKRAAQLLLELARKTKVQIVLSTGYHWLQTIGKVIDLDEEELERE